MAFAELWLPIFGASICIAWAVGAWYGGSKHLAIWLIFGGVVCLALLATLQAQHAVERSETPNSNRPWIGIDRIDLLPLAVGSSLRAEVYFFNTGNRPALNVRAHVQATTVPRGGEPPEPLTSLPLPDNPTAVIMPTRSLRIIAFNDDQFALKLPGDVELIKSGALTPWITARVEYSDSYGGSYYTMFRGVLDLKVGTYIIANPGNEAK